MKTLFKLASYIVMISLLGCNTIGDVPEILLPKPQPVSEFTALAGDASVALSWKNIDTKNTENFELSYSPNTPGKPIILSSKVLSYNVTDLINGTEYTFSIKAVNEDNASDVVTVTATPKQVLMPAKFLTFKFEVDKNPDMALDVEDRVEIVGVINETEKTITFREQSAYIYFDKLVPTFTVDEDVIVKVGTTEQVSGKTANDYSSTLSYILVKGEDQTVYNVTMTKSQYATIPDANFLAFLKTEGSLKFNNSDQLDITDPSVTARTAQLNCDFSKSITGVTIKSIKGIEFFTKIVGCRIERNEITYLDLRKNIGYTAIVGGWNKLAYIDISNSPEVSVLYLQGNLELKSLDLSKHPNLARLYTYNTGITELNVSNQTNFNRLYISVATAESSKPHLKKMFNVGEVAQNVVRYYGGEGVANEETQNTDYVLDLTGVE